MTTSGSPRAPCTDVPADVRRQVDEVLGSPVVEVSPRTGGFSPGPAVVVTCASGRRAFVKAVGTPLNPDTPDLLRTEGRLAAALPDHLPVPRLLGTVDDGVWQKDLAAPHHSQARGGPLQRGRTSHPSTRSPGSPSWRRPARSRACGPSPRWSPTS